MITELSFDQAWQLHKNMWMWLSKEKNANKYKYDWPKYHKYAHLIINQSDCFACYIASKYDTMDIKCSNCPIQWPYNIKCLDSNKFPLVNSIYASWILDPDKHTKIQLALTIATLPWKIPVEKDKK